MAINVVARKVVRAQLATLIQTAITSAGLTATVIDYAPKTLDNSTATVSVSSVSSERDLLLKTTVDNAYSLDIWIYVPRTGNGHDEEDLLDDLERAVSSVIEDEAESESYWKDLGMLEKTQATYVMVGGLQYRAEVMPVVALPREL